MRTRWAFLVLSGLLGCDDGSPADADGGGGGTGDAVLSGTLDAGDDGRGDDGGGGRPQPGPACETAAEVCDALDNDCDGLADEIGCACTGGDPACYVGPPPSRGVGACRDGTRACDELGEFFGPCTGSVVPAAEACDGVDNDCDGLEDEGCCGPELCPEAGPSPPDGGGDRDAGGGGSGGDGGGPGGSGGGPGGDGGGPGGLEEIFVVGEEVQEVPVDYLMVVDNSTSMNDTVEQVEANLGDFAARLAGAGLDFRFVMLAERGDDPDDPDVCITPPLAGEDCGDTDRYLHLDQEIDSHDAFERILECADDCDEGSYRDFLRPGALLQLILVTDDESDLDWDDFEDEMADLGFPEFTLHGVVGLREDDCVAGVGEEYIEGAGETDGELLHICDRDWGRVLEVIFDSTLVQVQSVYRLAGRPDPATIRVFVTTPGGAEQESVGTWDYDAAANAVVFREGAVPPVGSRVRVTFLPR